ncbi:MAG: U32 family peptidase, partial [Spirochaetaceae bacterium]
MNKKPELLSPAGNVDSLYAAMEAGADAVYLGLDRFNARIRARNFTPQLAATAISWAHKRNKKIYITLNTLIKEIELPEVIKLLSMLEAFRPDAIIVADFGVISLVRKHFPGLVLHASTQAGAHNSEAIRLLSRMGIKRTILARELSIQEIKKIRVAADNIQGSQGAQG